MSKVRDFDAHEAVPSCIKDLYKVYQKLPRDKLEGGSGVVDIRCGLSQEQQDVIHVAGTIPRVSLNAAYGQLGMNMSIQGLPPAPDVFVYEFEDLPGERCNIKSYTNESDH